MTALFATKAGQSDETAAAEPIYRPSNGSEMQYFASRWCGTCPEQRTCFVPERLGDPGSGLWRVGAHGPKCTAYTGDADPDGAKAAVVQGRYDGLARDPATGRPVIA